jgi:hypothetical protein
MSARRDMTPDMRPDSTRPWVLTRMLVTVRQAIDQAGARGMGRTEIYRMLHDQITSAELDTLTGHLLATGRYERETAPTAGRPVTVYRRCGAVALPAWPDPPADALPGELRSALAGVPLSPAEAALVGELDRADLCRPLAALITRARSLGPVRTVTNREWTR